jgi:hypothetical protein
MGFAVWWLGMANARTLAGWSTRSGPAELMAPADTLILPGSPLRAQSRFGGGDTFGLTAQRAVAGTQEAMATSRADEGGLWNSWNLCRPRR